jgi:hypothetical protein
MSLGELAIKNAKPNHKSYRMKDESGLYLEILPTGKKSGACGIGSIKKKGT